MPETIYKILKKHWAELFIFFIVSSFFVRLYFPPSLFYTPDFGQSDALNFILPMKYEVAQNLRDFRLPLWTNTIGQGYPIIAGSIDIFFLPNLVIFALLPFNIAFPTMYLSNFLIAALGMFFLLKHLKIDNPASIFGAISFSFSAAMILRVQHSNLQGAVAMLPIAILSFTILSQKVTFKRFFLTSVILSQILFGFVQIFVYGILILFIFFTIHLWIEDKRKLKTFIPVFVATVLFALVISTIQILPNYELLTQSQRGSGVNPTEILNAFPLFPKNLLSFLNPFILGKASDGTYDNLNWVTKGIFWENTGYIGIIPLIFAAYSLFTLLLKRKNKLIISISLTLLLTILLALGKFSPTHILFSIPPFNFFRVPSRFLAFTQLFLVILAALGIKQIGNLIPKKMLFIFYSLVIFLTVFDLFHYWWNYNPIGKQRDWLKKPDITHSLDNNTNNYRVYSFGIGDNWNKIFLKAGWKNNEQDYLFFMNSLAPNFNALFGIQSFTAYEALPTRRFALLESIVFQDSKESGGELKIGKKMSQIINTYGILYLISPTPINSHNYEKFAQINKDNNVFYVYKNPQASKKAKIYYDFKKVTSINDYVDAFENQDLTKTALIEKDLNETFIPGNNSIEIKSINNTTSEYEVETVNSGIFVVSDSYYPGWKAKIDSKDAEIFPANINSRAVIVPAGKHKVEMIYRPNSVLIGSLITIFTISISVLILFRTKILWKKIFKLGKKNKSRKNRKK